MKEEWKKILDHYRACHHWHYWKIICLGAWIKYKKYKL